MDLSLTSELSEFIGVVIGDGCLYGKHGKYMITITGGIATERSYFKSITGFLDRLGVRSSVREHSRGLVLVIYNKELFSCLTERMGMKYSTRKSYEAEIPEEVTLDDSNMKACLRGIFDTDGTVFTSDKTGSPNYPTIEITTASEKLSRQIFDFLCANGYGAGIRQHDSKKSNAKRIFRVSLNGYSMIDKWYKEIGSSNPVKFSKMKKIINGDGGI